MGKKCHFNCIHTGYAQMETKTVRHAGPNTGSTELKPASGTATCPAASTSTEPSTWDQLNLTRLETGTATLGSYAWIQRTSSAWVISRNDWNPIQDHSDLNPATSPSSKPT